MRTGLAMKELKVRELLTAYAAGREPYEAMAVASARLGETVDVKVDPSLTPLVHELELYLAEFTSGHWAEDELRAALGALAVRYWVTVPPETGVTLRIATSTASAAPLTPRFTAWVPAPGPAAPSPGVGRRSVPEPV